MVVCRLVLAGGRGDSDSDAWARADLAFRLSTFKVLDQERRLRGVLLMQAAFRFGGVDSDGGAVFWDAV